MIKFLDLQKQYSSIKREIDEAIRSVINDCAFVGGKYLNEFENSFAEYIGVKHCIGVGNGTDALEIAIESLDLPGGSEIIVPGNSFIASSEAVTRAGHKVIFCDCNERNLTISIDDLQMRITENTKAVIAVHLYGHPCDMDAVEKIAKENNLKVIEDCAQVHGAEYRDCRAGTFGDIAIFSFYPGKNLGAYGDGGAIVTNVNGLARVCRMISNHGRLEKFNHEFEGRNSRLDGIQAAILNVKLRHLDEWTRSRIAIAKCYTRHLRDCGNIILPACEEWATHVYHLFVIRAENRDALKEHLNGKGIQTGIHYPIALPKLKAYRYLNQHEEDMLANRIDNELLSLPMGEHLEEADIETIASLIKEFYL